jgi:hypothetical protein
VGKIALMQRTKPIKRIAAVITEGSGREAHAKRISGKMPPVTNVTTRGLSLFALLPKPTATKRATTEEVPEAKKTRSILLSTINVVIETVSNLFQQINFSTMGKETQHFYLSQFLREMACYYRKLYANKPDPGLFNIILFLYDNALVLSPNAIARQERATFNAEENAPDKIARRIPKYVANFAKHGASYHFSQALTKMIQELHQRYPEHMPQYLIELLRHLKTAPFIAYLLQTRQPETIDIFLYATKIREIYQQSETQLNAIYSPSEHTPTLKG